MSIKILSFWPQVGEYPPETIESGITFIYATANPEGPLQPGEIYVEYEKIRISTYTSTSTSTAKPHSTLSLPPSLGQLATDDTRVSFILYRKTSLFTSRSLNKDNKENVKSDTIPNTRIISATVYGADTTNLTEPVNSSFAATQTANNKVKSLA